MNMSTPRKKQRVSNESKEHRSRNNTPSPADSSRALGLHLVRLPAELLDSIFEQISRGHAATLRLWARQLAEAGRRVLFKNCWMDVNQQASIVHSLPQEIRKGLLQLVHRLGLHSPLQAAPVTVANNTEAWRWILSSLLKEKIRMLVFSRETILLPNEHDILQEFVREAKRLEHIMVPRVKRSGGAPEGYFLGFRAGYLSGFNLWVRPLADLHMTQTLVKSPEHLETLSLFGLDESQPQCFDTLFRAVFKTDNEKHTLHPKTLTLANINSYRRIATAISLDSIVFLELCECEEVFQFLDLITSPDSQLRSLIWITRTMTTPITADDLRTVLKLLETCVYLEQLCIHLLRKFPKSKQFYNALPSRLITLSLHFGRTPMRKDELKLIHCHCNRLVAFGLALGSLSDTCDVSEMRLPYSVEARCLANHVPRTLKMLYITSPPPRRSLKPKLRKCTPVQVQTFNANIASESFSSLSAKGITLDIVCVGVENEQLELETGRQEWKEFGSSDAANGTVSRIRNLSAPQEEQLRVLGVRPRMTIDHALAEFAPIRARKAVQV